MKLNLWIGLLFIGILIGLWATFRIYTVGFSLYAKTDVLVWTLPLSTYIFFSLTSAGLAFVSSFPVVFGIKRYEVIEKRIVTIGLVNSSQIHPREVFADVIADRAAAVIFSHNHPSGDPKPSETDAKTHRQLTEAGTILGLRILDHIIVAKKKYFSFQEAGLIN